MSREPHQPLVLVADDDPTIRLVARETLLAAGYRVNCAADGREALALFESDPPDLVLLDMNMPNLDGLTACRIIRDEYNSEIPVLIVTGEDDMEAVHRAFDTGATDFVSKPVRWPALPFRVRYALRSSQLRAELASNQHHTRALLNAIPDEIYLIHADGSILDQINQNVEAAAGNPDAPAVAQNRIEDVFPAHVAHTLREHLHVVLSTRQSATFEFMLDEDQRTWEARLQPHIDNRVLAILRDVTERHKSEARIRELAYFDNVTGLPNRQYFVRELRRAMRHARRNDKKVSILYIDLDRFKRINDTFGHSVGDSLLKSVAKRIAACIRPLDLLATESTRGELPLEPQQLARFGGDEFVVLLADMDDAEQARKVSNRILQTLQSPFDYDGRQFVVTPSIGVSLFPDHGDDVETLLMRADMAMYEAKGSRNSAEFYVPEMDAHVLDRLKLESDLRNAIESRDLTVYFQPKHDLRTGRIVGAEALLRWQHAERGWVSPADFVVLAEEAGLIEDLGNLVIDDVCKQLRDWQDRNIPRTRIAINVSAEQVLRSDVADIVLKAVWHHGIRPQDLEVELTESVLMQDIERAEVMLATLKDAGIRVSIDDFGTGYSSLSYVRQFPIDALKIDRSFVRNLHMDKDDAAICGAIIAMAKQLSLHVIAEGVELEEQRKFLIQSGCHEAQGFLFSEPMPASDFEKLLLNGADTAAEVY